MADGKDLAGRLAFLELGPDDCGALEKLAPHLERHADAFVGAFYRHLLSFDPTRQLLRDPEVKTRLVKRQREYLLSLARPSLDPSYVDQRVRIGETHMRIDLEPRWYLGAYALYFRMLSALIQEVYRGNPAETERTLAALVKVLMLDAQLAMEAYIGRREQDLEYLNRELSEANRFLTHDSETRELVLRQTTHRAETAEQLASIATLVAGLAHEIGTPMGVIRGHAELLESAADNERSRWRAGQIREQVDRISRIIQTLLNMARPHEPVSIECDLEQIVDSTLAFLRDRLRRRAIGVTADLEKVAPLRGDPDRLQQLCLNLLLNAVDAMPEGGELSVTLQGLREVVVLGIRDTGCGIPEDQLSQIFDPFFTTKPAGEGNGLGLVVAQSIVSSHGGTLKVSSQVGKGTEFRITLPIKAQSEPPRKSGA